MSIRIVAAVAACVSCSIAIADQSDSSGDLDTVVVTASRLSQPISDVIGSATVIDREEIERRQPQSVQDLLRGEAGIDIYNNGGLGKVSGIFMRGSNTAQTLILVDGQRLGSATDGTTAIQFIPVDQIERIEIVRGPRSSLYGSDAIGGVIQIFTRKANGVNASIGYGYHDTENYNVGAGYNNNGWRMSVTGNYMQSNGFNACRIEASLYGGGCFAYEPDDDRYRNLSGSTHIGYKFGNAVDIELHDLYSNGYTEYDGYFNQGRFTEHAPGIDLKISPTKTLALSLSGSITHDNQDNYHNGQFLSRYNTEKHNASLLSDWNLAPGDDVMIGVDYLRDHIDAVLDPNDPTTVYATTSRNSHGVFAEYLGKKRSHEFSASIRSDNSNQYGTHNTGSVGWKWHVDKSLALNAGYGQAFHAPTFNDLYFPYGSGNPNLKPESSKNIEVGASGDVGLMNWSAQAYQNRVKDLIALDSNYSPVNTGALIRGVELMAQASWKKFNTSVNYTWLDPRNRQQGSNYDKLLPRRARQSGRIEVGYDFDIIQLTGIINVAGPRFDDLANNNRLGGYTTVDLSATWKLLKSFSAQLKLNNVLDHRYETSQYYYQESRSAYVTLRYQSK